MAKARSTEADLHDHASALAAGLAKGLPPEPSEDLLRFVTNNPNEVFAAAEGAFRHLPPAGDDEPLGVSYLFLLQMLLMTLKERAERGYPDAIELIDEFQADLALRAEADEIDGTMIAVIGGVMRQAGIAASPELLAISSELNDDEGLGPEDIATAMDDILEACEGDVFALVDNLGEVTHTLPEEAKLALVAGLAQHEHADARAAVVLFLQDGSPAVRHAAAEALAGVAPSLSPVDLRRLIAIRNWRPDAERGSVDAVIQKARAAGVACAAWPKGAISKLQATGMDGSGAQVFLMISPVDRKTNRVLTILAKYGVADTVTSDPVPQREINRMIEASTDTPMLEVSRGFLDRMVAHHLALMIGRDAVPPAGLIEVAEIIGGAEWQPALIPLQGVLDEMLADLPDDMKDPEDIVDVLEDSDSEVELDGLEESWFEDCAEIADVVLSASEVELETLPAKFLQDEGVIGRQRARWADLFVLTALWTREDPQEYPCWADLAVVARAVREGHDLNEIGLMRAIAERTVDYLLDEGDDSEGDLF